ncbi:MAG: glycosyltransferase [Acidobacteriota bacterium]
MHTIHAVIVHHRGFEMLGECLESLLASVEVDLKIVIVLNGCDEALPDIVKDSDRVHVVESPEPVGFSAANNLGVSWADEHLGSCSSYYFVNNDTVSEPEALARQAAVLEEDSETAVVGPQLLIQWAPAHLNSLGLNVTSDGWGWDEGIGISLDQYGPRPTKSEVLAVTGSALLIRSEVFNAVGGWTELYDYYFEDIDLCLKVRRAGWSVVNEPAAVVFHAVSATTGLDSEWKDFLFWRNRLLLAMLHWPFGLLLSTVFPIVVIDGIVAQLWQDSRLQRKALMGALRRLPRIVWLRLRLKGRNRAWVAMLKPPGSVPVITLPEMPVEVEQTPIVREDILEAEASVRSWREALGDDQSAVVILGTAPLPFEQARMNYAPGARTWQFARGLVAGGIRPLVLCERMPGGYDEPESDVEVEQAGTAMIVRMSAEDFHAGDVVPRLIKSFDPACLVGASAKPSGRAVEVANGRPVWVDLFGDPMAEAQARAARCSEGDQLTAYRDLVATLVENGDAFSVVSHRQHDAALGQLGLLGRLNRRTAGHELIHVIPCGIDGGGDPPGRDGPSNRGSSPVPDDAFVILWSGGFNTWCDVDILARGVEEAMKTEPKLHLVVTGGAIAGHDDDSWREWVQSVEASAFADRIHILGSLPTDELRRWIDRADLGLITEKALHERELGSSGRVVGWLEAGLPFVATAQSELVLLCVEAGAAFAYTPGDADSLASTLEAVCRERDGLAGAGQRAQALASTFDATATTAPLARWVVQARPAPDREGDGANPLSHWALAGALDQVVNEREVLRREKAHLEAEVTQAKSQLGEIHTSAMWRTWAVLRRLKAIATYPWRKIRGRTGG